MPIKDGSQVETISMKLHPIHVFKLRDYEYLAKEIQQVNRKRFSEISYCVSFQYLSMSSMSCFFFFREACLKDGSVSKPVIDESLATCILQEMCTGVQCCVSVPRLGLSVETFVQISACQHQLRVGIEKLHFNRSLTGYKFGEREQFDLYGFVVIE